ncbi:DNA-processing protein DprA [Novosphingobium sp. 9]|uniref:DNA-processing protein DprA n=1 Tax=Novosphingobium sp. 9 TaxID=2025349 RepID=UPI0021B5A01E|nr:DNA-processing protein DprA [Novosphingobium sp. 9]
MSTTEAISQDEAFSRIRLLRSPHIGPVSYIQLLRRFGSGAAALEALPELAGRAGRKYVAASIGRVQDEIAAMRKSGARYLFHDSQDYPEALQTSDGAPPILTWRGDIGQAHKPCVAIVGARNASAAALRLARELALELSEAGFVVVSGLARGIDGAAHRGALAATCGAGTVGVIASGIDVSYPPEHADLQEQIALEGLLLAEQPCGTEPLARHFPTRNRIIASLCSGTVVVEAAPKSGSLITARLAGEMGREVMAIPGSPLDPRSQGCNQLIRDGAILVQNAGDVMELLRDFSGRPRGVVREPETVWTTMDENEGRGLGDNHASSSVNALLGGAPVAIDELIRQSGANAGDVQMALLELELAGRLVRHAGGRVSLLDS